MSIYAHMQDEKGGIRGDGNSPPVKQGGASRAEQRSTVIAGIVCQVKLLFIHINHSVPTQDLVTQALKPILLFTLIFS